MFLYRGYWGPSLWWMRTIRKVNHFKMFSGMASSDSSRCWGLFAEWAFLIVEPIFSFLYFLFFIFPGVDFFSHFDLLLGGQLRSSPPSSRPHLLNFVKKRGKILTPLSGPVSSFVPCGRWHLPGRAGESEPWRREPSHTPCTEGKSSGAWTL